ncbi:AraC family transcriptional regulator [Thaumasiovibrio subtropicus]|uniref:AraC family transcriptional regulator n=1 Tax=Thaumasiovibrio subtropicus TaxID=1891207 RepID=UPI000B353F07|nr:AraC family transcriptional regulator [Thaumasiovibrio subtropicus]
MASAMKENKRHGPKQGASQPAKSDERGFHDTLSHFIDHLAPQCEVFNQIRLFSPWGLEDQLLDGCHFSYLRQGECYVELPGEAPLRVESSQLLLIPNGIPHRLMSAPDVPCLSVEKLFNGKTDEEVRAMAIGGCGPLSKLICGHFRFSDQQPEHAHILLHNLPDIIILDAHAGTRLGQILEWLYEENSQPQSGSQSAIRRLLDLLVLEIFRALPDHAAPTGWIQAMQDRHLIPVMTAMVHSYQAPWRIEDFAKLAALSRSAFNARFTQIVGCAPLTFLRRWRGMAAAQYLRRSSYSISQIAALCGYQSADVFIRNFRSQYQVTPRQYRQEKSMI